MAQFDVVIDREAAARHGIAVGDVNDTIETAIAGKRATTADRGAAAVRASSSASRRRAARDIAGLERLLVPAPGGERVPLAQLAEIQLVEAPAQVSRENGMRRVVVEANIRGRDLGGFVADVQARLGAAREGAARRATSSSSAASSRTSSARCGSSPSSSRSRSLLDPAAPLPGARVVRGRPARAAEPAVRAGGRRRRRRGLPDAGVRLGGGRLHRAARDRGAERGRARRVLRASSATGGARSPRPSARGATCASGRSS